jgi:hypothetical protein
MGLVVTWSLLGWLLTILRADLFMVRLIRPVDHPFVEARRRFCGRSLSGGPIRGHNRAHGRR